MVRVSASASRPGLDEEEEDVEAVAAAGDVVAEAVGVALVPLRWVNENGMIYYNHQLPQPLGRASAAWTPAAPKH